MDIKNDKSRDFILITPAKNEEKNLPKLAKCIIEQTIRPNPWVIVDDGSIDQSQDIIKNLEETYNWIKGIRLSEGKRDLGFHVSHVCREGFSYAIDYCKQNYIHFAFIGLVDADIMLEKEYFEKLIHEFEKNPNLGIASGRGANIIGKHIVQDKQRDDLPTGGARLWKKQTFEETGGYLLTKSADSVSNVKAILNGWDTKQFDHIRFLSTRGHASAEGLWKGHKIFGANNYFIGYTFPHALLKAIKLSFGKPHYTGIAYFYGYFNSLIYRKTRIDDYDVLNYYRYRRPREIYRNYLNYLKKLIYSRKG